MGYLSVSSHHLRQAYDEPSSVRQRGTSGPLLLERLLDSTANTHTWALREAWQLVMIMLSRQNARKHIDTKGNRAIPVVHSWASDFNESLAQRQVRLHRHGIGRAEGCHWGRRLIQWNSHLFSCHQEAKCDAFRS